METPIYTRLMDYHSQNRISFAMPGHKNMRGLACDVIKCDVTELSHTADLIGGDTATDRANELLRKFYNAKKSFILTGGSTACIKIMVSSALKRGDTLLTMPDCHMSVINACAVCGINMRMENDILNTEITPDIKAVLVTSPNYYGVIKNIKAISEKCHKNGVLLLVDEAHGAHFTGKYGLPNSSVECGADMVCQSAHKTLGALTGAAYLHICSDRVCENRVKRNIRVFHSSSPSYPIAASADIARAELKNSDYSGIVMLCNKFKKSIEGQTKIKFLANDDPTRLVADFSEYDISGFLVLEILCDKYGIDVEMADLCNIVLIVTPCNTAEDFEALFGALSEIVSSLPYRKGNINLPAAPSISGIFSPQDGFWGETERVDLADAVGRISAQTVCMYPPGTAAVATGCKITLAAVEYILTLLDMGAYVSGISDGKIEVIL